MSMNYILKLSIVCLIMAVAPETLEAASATKTIRSNHNSTSYELYSTQEEKQLFEAIKAGDLDTLTDLLIVTRDADINATFETRSCFGYNRGGTVLHSAVSQPEVIKLLLNEGADLESFSADHLTPLMLAAERGELETVKILLKHGANVDAKAYQTALIKGIKHLEIVKFLLDAGANPNLTDKFGSAPLWWAISDSKNPIEVVELLIGNGADISFRNKKYRETLLHTAVYRGNIEAAKLLLDKELDVNATDNKGRTPLYWSISYKESEFSHQKDKYSKLTNNQFTQLLLDAGASTDDKSAVYFPWSGNTTLVQKSLNKATNVDVLDDFGRTPLHVAAAQGNLELAKWLIDKGADVNILSKDFYGYTPLMYSIFGLTPYRSGLIKPEVNIKLITLLLTNGADPNIKYAWNKTSALHEVANSAGYIDYYSQSVKVAQALLDHGANVNVVNSSDETPLYRVYLADDNRIISFLAKNGADVNARNTHGRTALIGVAAAASVRPDNVELLLSLGADPRITNNDGKKAIDFLHKRTIGFKQKMKDALQHIRASGDLQRQQEIEWKIKMREEDWEKRNHMIKMIESVDSTN